MQQSQIIVKLVFLANFMLPNSTNSAQAAVTQREKASFASH